MLQKKLCLGVNQAMQQFPDTEFILYGNQEQIKKTISTKTNRIHIIHTNEQIEATDEPVRAVRRKKEASMVMMAQAVKDGEADACISAGNTGCTYGSRFICCREN